MVLPLSVGRFKSILALEAAMRDHDKLLCVVAQKDTQLEDPQASDLYALGCVAEVVQFLKMPDGTLKIFLQGRSRAKTMKVELSSKEYFETELEYPEAGSPMNVELKALMRHAVEVFDEHC